MNYANAIPRLQGVSQAAAYFLTDMRFQRARISRVRFREYLRKSQHEQKPVQKFTPRLGGNSGGDLLRPGDSEYDGARRIWNGMAAGKAGILIARCADVVDVHLVVRAGAAAGNADGDSLRRS